MSIRILIADDHSLIATGLQTATAHTEIEIVGHIASCDILLESLNQFRPDVLVSEVRVGGSDVIQALSSYDTVRSGFQIIFFSANENPAFIARAGVLGCHDYLSKKSPTAELLAAIIRASTGQPTPASSRLKKTQAKFSQTKNWDAVSVVLTPREQQVLQHLAMGMSNREIGRSLSIKTTTVKEYVQNIMRKLDAGDRTQAAVWAVRSGII